MAIARALGIPTDKLCDFYLEVKVNAPITVSATYLITVEGVAALELALKQYEIKCEEKEE